MGDTCRGGSTGLASLLHSPRPSKCLHVTSFPYYGASSLGYSTAGLLHHCPLGDYQTGWDWHRGCIKPMRNSSTVGDVVVVFLACRLGYSWIGWHFGIWGEWIGDNCTYVSVVVISDNGSNGLWGWCRERSVNGLSWSKVFSDTHCVSVCKLEGWCPLCSLPYLCGGVMLISLHCHIHVPC